MRLRELFEAVDNDVAIIFGRFNPPHKGHKAAWELMRKDSSNWFVGTNASTQGPKDPLPYDVKIEAMKAVDPTVEGHLMSSQSWLTMISELYEKFPKAKLIVYTDEEWVVKTINQYNGVEGKAHGFYDYASIEHRPTPRVSSATELRAAVQAGDRESFTRAAGIDADTEVAGKPYFDLVAEYLLPYSDKVKKKTKEDAAGVGIITKQNTTKDVNKGTLRKMMKGYRLI
jgi:nicotinamide mononucleotide adenylyltransferase